MDHLLWIDLEMTGLDPNVEGIIEVAALVTDLNLEPQSEYHCVVFQPQHKLDAMDDWNRRTHGHSGLLERIPTGRPLEDVDREIVEWMRPFFPDDRPVLAGNSIHQDRRFIDRYMPQFAASLHYRMIDVSSFKLVFRTKFGLSFEKKGTHRALDDIRESIEELKYYLGYIVVPEADRNSP